MVVLTTWSVDDLARELKMDNSAIYVLSNSRSLTSADACSLGREIGANLKKASMETGAGVTVVSRTRKP